jgi:hypothetical protein
LEKGWNICNWNQQVEVQTTGTNDLGVANYFTNPEMGCIHQVEDQFYPRAWVRWNADDTDAKATRMNTDQISHSLDHRFHWRLFKLNAFSVSIASPTLNLCFFQALLDYKLFVRHIF